jgi:hypothetical protein
VLPGRWNTKWLQSACRLEQRTVSYNHKGRGCCSVRKRPAETGNIPTYERDGILPLLGDETNAGCLLLWRPKMQTHAERTRIASPGLSRPCIQSFADRKSSPAGARFRRELLRSRPDNPLNARNFVTTDHDRIHMHDASLILEF